MRFLQYAMNRAIREAEEAAGATPGDAQEKAQAVADEFQAARQKLAAMIDDRFNYVATAIHKNFSSASTIDKNSRDKIAQVLTNVIRYVQNLGQPAPPAPQSAPAPVEWHLNKIEELLNEADDAATHQRKIIGIGEYLMKVKDNIMQNVDAILQTLQRDMVRTAMTSMSSQLGTMGGQIGDIHQRITRPPLGKEERENVYHALANIGRATSLRARKGIQDRSVGDPGVKIFAGPRSTLAFDPTSAQSIKQAIERLEDPRNTRVVIDGKPLMFDLTDSQDAARLMDIIQGRTQVAAPATTPDQEAIKLAKKPRGKSVTFGAQQPLPTRGIKPPTETIT